MRSIVDRLNNINLCKNALKTNKLVCSSSFQLSEMKNILQKLIFIGKTLCNFAGSFTEKFLVLSGLAALILTDSDLSLLCFINLS